MLIIVDRRISSKGLKELSHWGEVIMFGTENMTYDAISCHPDVFFCMINDKIIVAANCPDEYKNSLTEKGIKLIGGIKSVGAQYPESAYYNAVTTDTLLIHNLKFTDKRIFDSVSDVKHINVNQAYTRCNLLHISGNNFITSDRGIEKKLLSCDFNILYINPEQINLPGFKHGFFGGCCGMVKNKLFINGSLQFVSEKKRFLGLCDQLEVEIIELTNEALSDIGSILFIQENSA